jgi:undecaprenyl-diphosphatase
LIFIAAFTALFLLLWLFFYGAGPLFEHGLQRAAKYTARFRHKDYLPVVLVLAAGIAAAIAAGDGFTDLAENLHADSPELHAADTDAHAWARDTRTPGSTTFFTIMTLIGTPLVTGLLVVVICAVLVMRKHWRWAVYLAGTAGTGGLINLALKSYFARARPDLAEALRQAHGYSFPSGHAMGATVTFGALAYLAIRTIPRWRYRAAALAFLFTMIAAIATSRVYLGVHWISDVAAGITAGAIWVTASTVAYETFRRIHLVRALRAKRA